MQSRWALSPSRVAGSVAPATITLSSRLWWSHANFGGEGRAVLPANVREFAVLGINSAPDCIISFMPTTGSVEIDGIDISKQRARALAKTNFAAVYAALPGNLTVIENLRFFGLLYGIESLRIRVEELLRQFDLAHLRHTKCGLLSSGEQTRAALAKIG